MTSGKPVTHQIIFHKVPDCLFLTVLGSASGSYSTAQRDDETDTFTYPAITVQVR